MMDVAQPNIVAVVVMAVLYMLLGWLWYSERLFGKAVAECCGVTKDKKDCKCCAKGFIGCFIVSFIMAYALGYFINMAQVGNAMDGIKVGLTAWLGFIATTQFSPVLWCGKSLKHYFIDTSFKLVIFAIWGAIFGLWQ